jgi:hypothetical protein
MRNISFSMTTEQFKARTKTVTRRLGWATLGPGDVLMGCLKCMGLKPGQKIERLGAIRVKSVRREPLSEMTKRPAYGRSECRREGFHGMEPENFVAMFCDSHACEPKTIVTRIEYEYVDPAAPPPTTPAGG